MGHQLPRYSRNTVHCSSGRRSDSPDTRSRESSGKTAPASSFFVSCCAMPPPIGVTLYDYAGKNLADGYSGMILGRGSTVNNFNRLKPLRERLTRLWLLATGYWPMGTGPWPPPFVPSPTPLQLVLWYDGLTNYSHWSAEPPTEKQVEHGLTKCKECTKGL